MKSPSVSLLLGVSVLLLSALTVSAVFVNISPNRPQFFTGESVSFRCEGAHSSEEWMLKRRDRYDKTETCGDQQGFGWFDGSSCIISSLSSRSDSGFYWCEDRSGQKSDELNIHVSDYVILEIPALSVMPRSDVTLQCRSLYEHYKLSSIRRKRVVGRHKKVDVFPSVLTIPNIQRSDEGFYSCSVVVSDMEIFSGESRLMVTGSPADPPPLPPPPPPPPLSNTATTTCLTPPLPPSPPPTTTITTTTTAATTRPTPHLPSVSVVRLFCHLVVFCPYCICTVLMVQICCSRKTGNKPVVSMETQNDDQYDDITAEVTIEHDLRAAQSAC